MGSAGEANGPVTFRWLGVAGIELEACGQVLLIDPFFTRPPLRRLLWGRAEPDHDLVTEKVVRCDTVLVTHAHWDHVMDVPAVALHTGATVLAPANACQLLSSSGLPKRQIRAVEAGECMELGGFRVRVLPAEHVRVPGFGPGPISPDLRSPLRLRDYRMDCCFSFLLEVGGLRLLDWRSVRSEPAPPADVLCIGMESKRAVREELLQAVRPRLVIPVHWDDMFRPLSEPIRPLLQRLRWALPPARRRDFGTLEQMVESLLPGGRVLVPEIFQDIDLQECLSTTRKRRV